MRVTTLRTYKLRELVNYNYIHSVVLAISHYGTSMCIAIKGDIDTDIQYTLNLRRYGPGPGTVLFISMDNRFTYHYPIGMPFLPEIGII